MVLGVLVGMAEGAWIAHEASISLLQPGREVIGIGAAYAALFAFVYLLLRLARRWSDAQTPHRILMVISALWVIPYQLGWGAWGLLAIGLSVLSCWAYGRLAGGLRLGLQAGLAVVVVVWTLGWIGGLPEPSKQAESGAALPNVVVVVIDTLRADRLGCYGHAPEGFRVSPHLDALAEQGVVFDNALAQAPWTRPSTASLFSSLYPASHRIVTPYDPLGAEIPTLAKMFDRRGYVTAAFSANPQVSPSFGFHHGFHHFWSATAKLRSHSAGARLVDRWGRKLGLIAQEEKLRRGVPNATADDVNEAVLAWAEQAEPDAPTFLYVHYLDPHDPYAAPEDLLRMTAGPDVDEEPLYASQELPPYPLEGSTLVDLGAEEMRELQRRYDTEIRFVDDRLQRMLDDLRARGLYGDGDWLVITSDHGEEFHEHEQWQHGRSLFEEMVHVPLIVLGPDAPAGMRVAEPVGLVDVLPTLAAATGGPPDFPVHGQDLFPNNRTLARSWVLTHRPREQHPIWGLRTAERKLIWVMDRGRRVELAYDLTLDPREQVPLEDAQDESWQALRRQLEFLVETSGDLGSGGQDAVELDEDMLQKLGQLGYIDGLEEEAEQGLDED